MNPHFQLCRPLHLLVFTLCISLSISFAAAAQTNMPAPLPPPAQEALDKGIIAAKVPDYPLAIRYFEDARKIAPDAPVIYLNLGIAESKIPSRELRAIAWLAAYLAAVPNAPNAAAVKEQIAVLDIRNQSNLRRLIAAVPKRPRGVTFDDDWDNADMASLWAMAGDRALALKTLDLLPNDEVTLRNRALRKIGKAQALAGDGAGALTTFVSMKKENSEFVAFEKGDSEAAAAISLARNADIVDAQRIADIIETPRWRAKALAGIGEAQLRIGNIESARRTFASALSADPNDEASIASDIVFAQAKHGDISGAQTSVGHIQREVYRESPLIYIAEAQAKSGDLAAAMSTVHLIANTDGRSRGESFVREAFKHPSLEIQYFPSNPPPTIISPQVTNWLSLLDDEWGNYDCPLHTEPFLDLAGYLQSLPQSDDASSIRAVFVGNVERLAIARNVIAGMLKQQGIQ